MAVGLFLAVALYSYNPSDPSLNSTGFGGIVKNSCGYLGSFLSDLSYQFFGIASWVLVIGLFRYGMDEILGKKPKGKEWLWNSLFLILGSILLDFYFDSKQLFNGQIRIGGFIGNRSKNILVSLLNDKGVAILLWSSLIIVSLSYSDKRLMDWARSLWKPLAKLRKSLGTKKREEAIQTTSQTGPKFLIKPESREEQKASSGFGVIPFAMGPAVTKNGILESTENITKVQAKICGQICGTKGEEKIGNDWTMPAADLLEVPSESPTPLSEAEIQERAKRLADKLAQFSVHGEVVGASAGPAVTLYEFKPRADVRISRITDLADDLALALSCESIRVIAPIPGRDVVGIETSNHRRDLVHLRESIERNDFWECQLPLPLGKKANGEVRTVDLRKMPHLLVAGTTGSGKSVFVVSFLTGLLFRHSPQSLRLILIDPKQVELAQFENVPHLLLPSVKDPRGAVKALKWTVKEMEKRYRSMSRFGARGLESFNETTLNLTEQERAKHEELNSQLASSHAFESYYYSPQPLIVVVVEEFGDLMSVDKVNVEHAVVRLAQMARASGIHLVLAMQSPRKDVVTGLIKTNIPGRISFKVASKMDSRIILDESGAERLLAQGDMLFLAPGIAKPERHHGPWVAESNVHNVVQFWCQQGPAPTDLKIEKSINNSDDFGEENEMDDFLLDGSNDGFDELYDQILAFVSTQKEVSASYLQRKFRLGYPRAARVIEIFEREGVVGPPNGSKPRQVLVNSLK